jgi:hypothetical protein
MAMFLEQQNSPDVPAQQQANKLIRLIRKLRSAFGGFAF